MDDIDANGQNQHTDNQERLPSGTDIDKPETDKSYTNEDATHSNGKLNKVPAPTRTHWREFWDETPIHDKLNTLFTFVIAGATVIYVIVASDTLSEIRNNKADTNRIIIASETQATAAEEISGASADFTDSAYWMEQHMDDAAEAIQDSVDTADRNTKTTITNAQKAFRDEQRAWLGVVNFSITNWPSTSTGADGKISTSPLDGYVVMINSGKTPALNISHAMSLFLPDKVVPGPPPEEIRLYKFVKGGATAPQGQSITPIGGQGRVPGQLDFVSSDEVIATHDAAFRAKTKYLFIVGQTNYDDVYGRRHTTTFCLYMYDPIKHTLGYCEEYNNMN